MLFYSAFFTKNVNHERSNASDVYFWGLRPTSIYYVAIKVVAAYCRNLLELKNCPKQTLYFSK